MIPKKLHLIWIGDQSKRPDHNIRSWTEHNPDWTVRVWDNDDLAEYGWYNAGHMLQMAKRDLQGVVDLMRWDILYNEGGVVVDAGSLCVRPLDDWLLAHEAFACWENEIARPGLMSNHFMAAQPNNDFFGQIINDIHAEPSVTRDLPHKTVGAQRLTEAFRRYQYTALTVLPSHYFLPEHASGVRYHGQGLVYARPNHPALAESRQDRSAAAMPA